MSELLLDSNADEICQFSGCMRIVDLLYMVDDGEQHG